MSFFEKVFRFGLIAIGLILQAIIVRNLFFIFYSEFCMDRNSTTIT